MNSLELEEINEIINQLSSPESGYESPERLSEMREYYTSYGNELGCSLQMVEQPQSSYRFRYITEFKDNPHGPLTGENSSKNSKTFPTVKLVNYPRKAVIRCWLCVSTDKDVHVHQLLTKNDRRSVRSEPHDLVVDAKNNFTAVFEGLNIIHAVTKGKKEYLESLHKKKCHIISGYTLDPHICPFDEKDLKNELKAMEKNKAVLFFEAFDFETHEKLCETFSNQIKNSKNVMTNPLKISRQSHKNGSVNGGTEVLLFVEKVTRDIKIRFFEIDETGKECWEDSAILEDLWHQVGIAFRTPRYKDVSVEEDRKVYFQLIRESDGSCSNKMEFYYQPDYRNQSNYAEPVVGKKRRIEEEMYRLESNDFNSNLEAPMDNILLKDVYLPMPKEVGSSSLSGILEDTFGSNSVHGSQQIEDWELPSDLASDCVTSDKKSELKTFVDSSLAEINNKKGGSENYKLDSCLFRCISGSFSPDVFYEILNTVKIENINVQSWKNVYSKTPLHMTIEQGKLEFIEPLLNAGFNVNAVDVNHNSALHLALLYDVKPPITALLKSFGADLAISNYDGEMPIHMGCRLRSISHLNFLVAESEVNCQNKKTGDTPLHIAAKYGYKDVAEILLKSGAKVFTLNYGNYTPLDYAVQNENLLVNLLLDHMISWIQPKLICVMF
ncbi:nuclear factor NF-kappa-B p110 subunit-like isoform X2 [Rhodnius prolixus]|uniref:nuclear factor NF-kappa-B p110 subunit-like isoform X2 n=1 Tax=Rhodnius prolixus TaxID=13249 RepID=UPI003D18B65D